MTRVRHRSPKICSGPHPALWPLPDWVGCSTGRAEPGPEIFGLHSAGGMWSCNTGKREFVVAASAGPKLWRGEKELAAVGEGAAVA